MDEAETIQARFPVRVRIFGVDAVAIPESEYRSLTRQGNASPATHRLTRLDKEPEVRTFILDRLGTDDVDRIRDAAIERFGAERVPSRSAVNRLVLRERDKKTS